MANSTMPLIGLLAVGGLAYYRFSEGEATTDSSTTSSTTTGSTTTGSTTTGSTTTGSTTETTDSDSDVNYVDEWIDPPFYSSNSDFKRFMQGEVDELHNPFSIHRLMGKTKWLSDSKVELIDYDWSDSKSGGIDIQIAQGYKVKLKITTDNWNYFKNSVYVNGDNTKESAKDYVNDELDGTGQNEKIEVWFYPNDRLEIDVDGEHSGAYTFGMKMDGGTVWLRAEGGTIDDGAKVKMTDIKIRNPNYDPDRFATEFNAPFGGFRLFKGLFAAFKGARIWKVFGLGGKATGAVGASRIAGTIPEGTKAVAVINKGDAIRDLKRVEGVEDVVVDAGLKTMRLKDGYKAVDNAGNVISDGKGLLKLEDAEDAFKIVKTSSSVGGGANTATGGANIFNRIFTGRNVLTGTMVAVGGSVAYGAYRIFGEILPEGVGDTLKNLTTPCPDQCEGSEDYDTCLEECNKAKQETQAKIGLVVVASILGLALILKKPSDSKSAEGYYVLRT